MKHADRAVGRRVKLDIAGSMKYHMKTEKELARCWAR